MSKTLSDNKELLKLFEQMIDIRFEYLSEKQMENHRYAYNILNEKYYPVVDKILDILEDKR